MKARFVIPAVAALMLCVLLAHGQTDLTLDVKSFPGRGNAAIVVDGSSYPRTGAGVAAAIATAIAAGGGTVDARGVCNATFSSELDIGNPARVAVTLLVPDTLCVWTSTQTNPAGYGFRVYPRSAVIGNGSGQGQPFNFIGAPTFRGVDLFVAHGEGEYGHLKGFTVGLSSGGIVSTAVVEVTGYGDNSLFESLTFAATTPTVANVPKVFYTHGGPGGINLTCCNATFRNISVEGQNTQTPGGTGSTPCTIGSASDTTVDDVFDRLNCVHPGPGLHNLTIQGVNTRRNHFTSVYLESDFGQNDTSTSSVYLTNNAGASDFGSVSLGWDTAGSNRWVIYSDSGTPISVGNIFSAVSGNCLYDSASGMNAKSSSNCFGVSFNGFQSWFTNVRKLAFQPSGTATSGAASPSLGMDLYGGWWHSGTGATANKFGSVIAQAATNNQRTLPMGRTALQATAAGNGTMGDVLYAYGNGDIGNKNGVLLPAALNGSYGVSGTRVQVSDGTGASGPAFYKADGTLTGTASYGKLLANCGTMKTTAAASNTLSCAWVTTSSACVVTQSNSTIVAWTYVAPTAGVVTVYHTSRAGALYSISCSAN